MRVVYEIAVSKSATSNSSSDAWRVDLSDSDSDVAPKGCYYALVYSLTHVGHTVALSYNWAHSMGP